MGGGARGCALTPATIAHLLRAGVPRQPGMRWVGALPGHPVRLAAPAERVAYTDDDLTAWSEPAEREGGPYPGPYVPDLTDRATFLLCVDEALRRGIFTLDLPGRHILTCSAGSLPAWDNETTRAELIEALARALSDP